MAIVVVAVVDVVLWLLSWLVLPGVRGGVVAVMLS